MSDLVLKKRTFDDIVIFVCQKISEMDIKAEYKVNILGMIAAIEIAHDEEIGKKPKVDMICGKPFCPHCGSELEWSEEIKK